MGDIVERLRHTAQVGIFTASMTNDYASYTEAADEIAALRAENARLREALEGIISHFDSDQGPGHSHAVPGIWDDDNPLHVAGTRCDWCAHWEDALAKVKGGTDAR